MNDLRWVVSPNRVTGVRLFILGGTSVLLLLLILGCLRRPSPRGAVPAPGTREEGIRAIAELDGCFERGERDEREYWIQRIALKKWVAAHPNPEESDPPPPGRGKTG